jgi:hypothetical protein
MGMSGAYTGPGTDEASQYISSGPFGVSRFNL